MPAVVAFQQKCSLEGRKYEEHCFEELTAAGFDLVRNVRLDEIGCEFDFVDGDVYFEAKGSSNKNRPGSLRTDTLKKALCNAALLKSVKPEAEFVLVTSDIPDKGAGFQMLKAATKAGFVDLVIHLPFFGHLAE